MKCILRILHRHRALQPVIINKTINDIQSHNRCPSLTNVTIDRFDNEIKANLNFTDIEFWRPHLTIL